MSLLTLCSSINHIIEIPFTFLFLCVGIFLTIKLGFPQFAYFRHFINLIKEGIVRSKNKENLQTMSAFHALFVAMATSIGIGNVVGPSLAIVVGGPGAMFWLLAYAFFGAATKLAEVTFALHFRRTLADGKVVGGPAEYLRQIHPFLAGWYGATTILLFAGWSGIQSKALAEILAKEFIPEWITGIGLALFVLCVLLGGARRVAGRHY